MATVFQIVEFTPQELKKLVKEALQEEFLNFSTVLASAKGPPTSNSDKKLLSLKQAASHLQVTTVTLAKSIKAGEISICVVGKRKKIKLSEIERYLSIKKNKQ